MRINSVVGYGIVPKVLLRKSTAVTSFGRLNAIQADTVSFKSNERIRNIEVDKDKAYQVAESLSTSTSGHRATYGSEDFTPEIVRLLTLGVADYAKDKANHKTRPTVLVGGDAREASIKSLPLIKDTLHNQGVNVIYMEKPVPTPVLALVAKEYNVDAAILMTASHNPWSDGGFNLVTNKGAIATPDVTEKIAEKVKKYADKGTFKEKTANNPATIRELKPYNMYKEFLDSEGLIDWENIKKSGLVIYYDSLSGAGNYVMPKLLGDNKIPFHNVDSKRMQTGPNPTKENLSMLEKKVAASNAKLKIGLANDGDADRVGVVDEKGNFIPMNDVLLLATYHLAKNKGIQGTVIRNQATSSQLDEVAEAYGLSVAQMPVGFKYIGKKILDLRQKNEDILVAGEESGGYTVHGHIPEKDGIIATLLIADLVAKENKPVSEILNDIKNNISNKYETRNTNIKMSSNEEKEAIMAKAQTILDNAIENDETSFGPFEIDIDKTEEVSEEIKKAKSGKTDGVKLYFTDGSNILIRKSGTEPLLRYYYEAIGDTQEEAKGKLDLLEQQLEIELNPADK